MRNIDVFDTTLRDGEQSAGVNLHAHEKLEIASQLERFGVDIMEAGFPGFLPRGLPRCPGDCEADQELLGRWLGQVDDTGHRHCLGGAERRCGAAVTHLPCNVPDSYAIQATHATA